MNFKHFLAIVAETAMKSHAARVPHRFRIRRGSILIYTCMVFPLLILALAFAIDVGFILTVRAQLQTAADAAALAGAGRALDERCAHRVRNIHGEVPDDDELRAAAAEEVMNYAALHQAGGVTVSVIAEDIEFFRRDPETGALEVPGVHGFDTVRVRTRRDDIANTPLPLYFANLFGRPTTNLSATGQATFRERIRGLGPAPADAFSSLLPLAVAKADWDRVVESQASGLPLDPDGDGIVNIDDRFRFDELDSEVYRQPDGIPELRLYPGNPNAGNGNFGTVVIGAPNGGNATVGEQLLHGPLPQDFEDRGGPLDFLAPFELSGEPGVSLDLKDEIASLVGRERSLLLYSQVATSGGGTTYVIVGVAGVRIMQEQLSGSPKGILVQPVPVRDEGAVPGDGADSPHVYAPTQLTR